MNSSNANNFDIEDNLESSFTEISSIEMDMAKIIEKMQKMETELSKFGKIEKEVVELHEENGKLKGQMTEMMNEMGPLKEENAKMKEQLAGMNAKFAELNAKQDADKLMFTNLIDDRINAQQIPPKFDSNELKKNKMDLADCAPKLSFANNELLITSNEEGWGSARAILPVPQFDRNAKEAYIVFYFEGHIKKTNGPYGVGMGFCLYQFPLEGEYLGKQQNSIGMHWKHVMNNCGEFTRFQQDKDPFKAGDKIGLGLIYEPKNGSVKCFGICNRKLLGSAELSPKFCAFPIFPAVGLCYKGNSIQLNFGNDKWDFDPRQIIHLFQ